MKHHLAAAVIAAILLGIFVLPGIARADDTSANRRIICKVFGPYCGQALRVSHCESHHHVWASNGQYLGLFQMGASERRAYGHGPDAWQQARAAWRYFVASGRDWSPWSCKP